jgi:hypothetical protein
MSLKLWSSAVLSIAVIYTAPVRAENAVNINATASTQSIAQLTGDPSARSTSGRDLQVISFEPKEALNKNTPRLLIQGGLHGNEGEASKFVLWLARRFARGESPLNQLANQNVAFDFLPYANPDGHSDGTRSNIRGVNLNRNFGILWGMSRENPGAEKFSEAETQAIRRLFAKRRYTAAIDVHGYVNWVVGPSAPEVIKAHGTKIDSTKVNAYRRWMNVLTTQTAALPGYQVKNGADLGDGGAFEDWAFWSQGTYAYCLELESANRFAYASSEGSPKQTGSIATNGGHVDLFLRYELFVYRTLAKAIDLAKDPSMPTLAGK